MRESHYSVVHFLTQSWKGGGGEFLVRKVTFDQSVPSFVEPHRQASLIVLSLSCTSDLSSNLRRFLVVLFAARDHTCLTRNPAHTHVIRGQVHVRAHVHPHARPFLDVKKLDFIDPRCVL